MAAAGRCQAGGIAAACGLLLVLVVLPRYYLIVAGLPGYWAWAGSAALLPAGNAYLVAQDSARTSSGT